MPYYIRKIISSDEHDVNMNMQKKIEQVFGIRISYVKASRVVAWKAKNSSVTLTEKILLELIGKY